MHDDHPLNKPAGQLVTAPRIRRLRYDGESEWHSLGDSSAHTEIKAPSTIVLWRVTRQLRAYGD